MAINVTCPSCHTRFKVGDQHAGKTGACPKCKGQIVIPELSDEVVIHEPELEAGAKNARGQSVLKPIARKQAKFQPNVMLIVSGLVLLSMLIAWLVGQQLEADSPGWMWVLAGGAIALGPPLAYAGYTFLRDEELGTFSGMDLILRSVACGLVYALLWGVYMFIAGQLWPDAMEGGQLEIIYAVGLGIFMVAVGGGTALVCFDFEYLTGSFHYALYLVVTIVLRLVLGLAVMPGLSGS